MKNMKYVGSHETTKGATMKNTFEIQNATADFSDYYSKNSISVNRLVAQKYPQFVQSWAI